MIKQDICRECIEKAIGDNVGKNGGL